MTIEILNPKTRAAWLKVRGKDVTASAVGALFGAHDFITIYELWALKTGRLPAAYDETAPMRRGRLLEPVAVAMMREERPDWIIHHNAAENTYYRDPARRLGATPDVIVDAPGIGRGVVQIKSVEASVYRRKWLDEDGQPEAPLWIALQAALEAHLTGASWAMVAPLVIGHGIEMPLIEIPIMPGVVAAIERETDAFWKMIAEGREPAPDYARDAGLIDRLYPHSDDQEEVDLTKDNRLPDLMDQRRAAIDAKSAASDKIAAIDAEVKAKMGAATIAHIAGGQRITWRSQRRAGSYVAPSVVRTIRYPYKS